MVLCPQKTFAGTRGNPKPGGVRHSTDTGEGDVVGPSPFPKRLVRDMSPRTAHSVAGSSQTLSLAWFLAALMG